MDTARIATELRTEHAQTLEAVATCAGTVASELEGPIRDGRRLAERLEDELVRHDVLAALAVTLEDAVALSGHEPPAAIQPAPPYVVVTSEGPMIRATLPGGRLVCHARVFSVAAGSYERHPLELQVDWVC